MSHSERLVAVVGEAPPAMSISFADESERFSGFLVFFSEIDPDSVDDSTPTEFLCLHCLLEDGDEPLALGLDLARVHGQVDFDPETGEWFVPEVES